MSRYKVLWTDMHSNIHHEQIRDLPKWIEQIKQLMDFWPLAYYPYGMKKLENGFAVEDLYASEEIQADWEYIRSLVQEENEKGFPMMMGYEWQGSGEDGDHNVFFKGTQEDMAYPLRYEQLKKIYEHTEAIAIPHHLAYQKGYRGKNWETQDDIFSPFVEIYSSHGSSENDQTCFEMNRHVHMGPRTGMTCVERGWESNHRFGVIASGDNHACPGVYGFGYCAVLAEDHSKEAIWDAFIHRRVYGVSKNKILLDFTIDDAVMGSIIPANTNAHLRAEITGGSAIDRIEILKDNRVIEMIPHTSTWEDQPLEGVIRFKFQLELGWGPDRRVFPDIASHQWKGSLSTPGKILSIEKCWSNFGQKLETVSDHRCSFEITSYKTTATGKWMGPSAITTEGFIFEIEDHIDSNVVLELNGETYEIAIRDLLYSSRVIPLMEEVESLLSDRYDFHSYYRKDSWWHNCYKIKISQATPKIGYHAVIERTMDTSECTNIRIRGWQKDGSAVWSSPIFIEK